MRRNPPVSKQAQEDKKPLPFDVLLAANETNIKRQFGMVRKGKSRRHKP